MLFERKAFGDAVPVGSVPQKSTRKRVRRGLGDHLRDALMAACGGHAIIASHSEKAWASITFEGGRHVLKLLFDGASAVEAGEDFIADLPGHEFTIPGHIAASADIIGVEHVLTPAPHLAVTAEILLLKDA